MWVLLSLQCSICCDTLSPVKTVETEPFWLSLRYFVFLENSLNV